MALGDTLKNYVIGVGIRDNDFAKGLNNMGSRMKSFVSQFGLLLGAGGLGMAFKQFADAGADIANFSSLTGIAVEDITALGGALEQFGGNVDTAKSSLQALQQGLSQAEWGQGSLLQTAALYGVELYNQDGSLKNAQQLLMGLASDFEHLTKAQQFQLGSSLGLDESTILLLQQGKSGVHALLAEQQTMGAMNTKQAQEAKKFNLEMTKLKQSLGSLGRSIAVDIMPPVLSFVKQLGKAVEWVRSLDTYTIMLAASFGAVGYAVKNLQMVMTVFSKSFLRANLPLLALITGLTVLFLLVEDIVGYFNGKDSIFGDFLENERVKKVIADIQNAFAWMKDLINNFSFDKLLDGLKSFAIDIKDAFIDTFVWMFEALSAIGSNLGALIFNPFIEKINNFLSNLPGKLGEIQIPLYEKMDIPSLLEVSDRRIAERAANAQNSTLNQNNTVNITVQSSGDSLQDITKAVDKGLNQNKLSSALLVKGM